MFDRIKFLSKNQEEKKRQLISLQNRLFEAFDLQIHLREKPIFVEPSEEEIQEFAKIGIPNEGRDALEVEEELMKYVFTRQALLQHPRFFSFVASSVSPYSVAGSILTDIYNCNAGSYSLSPCGGMIEEKLCTWMGSLAGYPESTCGGVFLSGGSISNLSAIIAARTNKLGDYDIPKGVAYLSDQTHSSVRKNLRMLGFRHDQIVILPSDEHFRMDAKLLEEAIIKDKNDGKIPFLVIGTLGTTNTGTIDPLSEIGDIAHKYNLWFHVDGAFGGSSLISPIYRNLSKGIEKSDSLTWDTHKWLMQTYSCSTLLVKDKQHLLDAFIEHPEYLDDLSSSDHIDGWDKGPEMSRPHRAIKLWFTLQATGVHVLEEMIEYSFYNAMMVEKELLKRPHWQIISKPSCGTINFRYCIEGKSLEELNELNLNITKEINKSGYAYIVTTKLREMKTIRLCLINADTTDEDIINTIEKIDEIAKRLSQQ